MTLKVIPIMDPILEKSLGQSRAQLFGLLQDCIFSEDANDDCPLLKLHKSLLLSEKYNYVMELNDEKINSILEQHEECIVKRGLASMQE